MITLYLFFDYTGMFDAGRITPNRNTTIEVDGVRDGTISFSGRTYPIIGGAAVVPLEAWMGDRIEITVTARVNNQLKHWSCETLTKAHEGVFTAPEPVGRDILFRLRRENENLLAALKKNAADIKKINDLLKSRFITGGTA